MPGRDDDVLPRHGLGLEILREQAEGYHGSLQTKQESERFVAVLWLAGTDGKNSKS